MNSLLKKLILSLLGRYQFYNIYQLACSDGPDALAPVDPKELLQASDPEIRRLVSYARPTALCFVVKRGDDVVGAAWYWHGEQYRAERNFWPLDEQEAKLVQITTAPMLRGQGVASQLIVGSARGMSRLGFTVLYARIWRRHTASENAFRNAGWGRIATVIIIQPLGRRLRFVIPARRDAKRLVPAGRRFDSSG